MFDVAVVGGGAAGMMAAITAARLGAAVVLIERNPKVGRKLYITGKGRCNVTNHCAPEEVLRATPRNGKFLYSAIKRTTPADIERFFTELGVPLKVERGNRVFPQSDRAADVIDALFGELRRRKVPVLHSRAVRLEADRGTVRSVVLESGEEILCKAIVLATGEGSNPAINSTGAGQRIAADMWNTVLS